MENFKPTFKYKMMILALCIIIIALIHIDIITYNCYTNEIDYYRNMVEEMNYFRDKDIEVRSKLLNVVRTNKER